MNRSPGEGAFRACIVSAVWLFVLTLLNIAAGGDIRATVAYAVPIALTAWHDVRLGFMFAAIGALCAWAGGAIPAPGVDEPLLIEGLWAFLRLSAVAVVTRMAAQVLRRRLR